MVAPTPMTTRTRVCRQVRSGRYNCWNPVGWTVLAIVGVATIGMGGHALWRHFAKRTPARGKPNNREVFPNQRGGGTIRDCGPDGRAKPDYDFGHYHGAGDPHAYDWDWQNPKPRGRGRPL